MKPLRVGLYDKLFYPDHPSITHNQVPPSSLQYVSPDDDCDVFVTTDPSANALGVPSVLWLPESRELIPRPSASVLDLFDLVLTNDHALLETLGDRGRWLAPIGAWITDWTSHEKTRMVSFLAKTHTVLHLPGYEVRNAVSDLEGFDAYGTLFGLPPVDRKEDVLRVYRFHIVVENSSYDWYITEKLCDAFATRTIPLYWGCPDLIPLSHLGFDVSGIMPFTTIAGLRALLDTLSEDLYEELLPAVETNFRRIRELYCTETLLEPILREYFRL